MSERSFVDEALDMLHESRERAAVTKGATLCSCNRTPDRDGRVWFSAGCKVHGIKSSASRSLDQGSRNERSALC